MSYPKKFITIFISAHGEDLNQDVLSEQKLYELGCSGSRVKQFYKLPLSGITGNITNDSDILDALYFNSARRLAHNREMNPVEKLHEIREEVLRYRNITREIQELNFAQRDFVDRHTTKMMELQRFPSVPDWVPDPSRISYNRQYSFQANPFVLDSTKKLSDVFERKFGIWVVDASISIALQLGLRPGTSSTNTPVSLMEMLEILPTTARTQRARDKSGASEPTLFDIMQKMLQMFGYKTCINVIDMSCRYRNWGRIPQNPDHIPRSFRDEAHSPKFHVTKYVHNILDVTESGQQIVEWVDDAIFKLADGTFCTLALPRLVATPVRYSSGFQLQVGAFSFDIDLDTFVLTPETDDVISTDGIRQVRFIHQVEKIFYIQKQPFVLFVHIRIVLAQPLITRYIRFTGIDSHKKRVWTLYQDTSFPFQTPYGTEPTYERRRLPTAGGGGKKNTAKRTPRSKFPKKHTKKQLRKLSASKKIKQTIRNKSKYIKKRLLSV
jgi:hypothetical protein